MSEVRRKYSPVDLQQVVTRVSVYNRPLNSSGGHAGALFDVNHEAAVASTENGQLYMIEKSKDTNDDINFKVRYREGWCRIVQVTQKDIRDWKLVKSVSNVMSCVTLETLFDECGSGYGFFTDNCWNGAQRMRVAANESEDGLAWQSKAAIIGAGAAAAAIGVLAVVFGSKKESKAQKQ